MTLRLIDDTSFISDPVSIKLIGEFDPGSD
jgi:hypothetical protein